MKNENFSMRLKRLVEETDLTVFDFCKEVNLPYNTVRRLLKMDGQGDVRRSTLIELANYFNCSIDYLCCRDNELKFSNKDEKNITFYKLFPMMNSKQKYDHKYIAGSYGEPIVQYLDEIIYEKQSINNLYSLDNKICYLKTKDLNVYVSRLKIKNMDQVELLEAKRVVRLDDILKLGHVVYIHQK